MKIVNDKEVFLRKVNEVMDFFDFQKVFLTMQALDWKWVNHLIESKFDLKTEARRYLEDMYKYLFSEKLEDQYISTGGFTYELVFDEDVKEGYLLKMSFIVESISSELY